MNQKKQKIVFAIILIVACINLISAYNWVCFSDGEAINFCGSVQDRVCNDDTCRYCMNGFDSTNNCHRYGGWNACNNLPPACSINGGGGSVDGNPPAITITSPVNNSIYTTKNILFAFSINEDSDVYYTDLVYGRGRWTRVCSDCRSYSKNRNFKEGINQLQVKAEDRAGNEVFKYITFFIDSKDPKIHKIEPKQGFANGNFSLQYSEENLQKINISYGNALKGWRKADLSGCSNGKKVWCSINLNLNDYNGQEITYYFSVYDKAGNVANSRIVKLNVDISAPTISNFNYTIIDGAVVFNMTVIEQNFDKVTYIDSFSTRPMEKTLCSKLTNNQCVKKVSFREGQHNVIIKAIDEAGNHAEKTAVFSI